TEGSYQYATAWERCGDEVVRQPIDEDAAPSKLIRSQGECAIDLLKECHEALHLVTLLSRHPAVQDQPASGECPCNRHIEPLLVPEALEFRVVSGGVLSCRLRRSLAVTPSPRPVR